MLTAKLLFPINTFIREVFLGSSAVCVTQTMSNHRWVWYYISCCTHIKKNIWREESAAQGPCGHPEWKLNFMLSSSRCFLYTLGEKKRGRPRLWLLRSAEVWIWSRARASELFLIYISLCVWQQCSGHWIHNRDFLCAWNTSNKGFFLKKKSNLFKSLLLFFWKKKCRYKNKD